MTGPYLLKIVLALASIFALLAGDRLPALTCCVARAFALAACALSGIGYLRDPGKPKVDLLNLLRRALLNSAMSVLRLFRTRIHQHGLRLCAFLRSRQRHRHLLDLQPHAVAFVLVRIGVRRHRYHAAIGRHQTAAAPSWQILDLELLQGVAV